MMRPDRETESVGVVAYVLDRLYRERTSESSLKVKEIECLQLDTCSSSAFPSDFRSVRASSASPLAVRDGSAQGDFQSTCGQGPIPN